MSAIVFGPGALIRPKPYNAAEHAIFRVKEMTRNGWVRCSVERYANGQRPQYMVDAFARFRVTACELHVEKGGAS